MDLMERATILDRADRDKEFRKDVLAVAASDGVFFANVFAWTFDPRLKGNSRNIPMLLFPQQEEFIRFMAECIDDGHDGLIEKSRDTGASWCSLIEIFRRWYFEPGFAAILGSRKEDYVDKPNDPSCLMWKLDFLYKMLPPWMRIPGYVASKPHRTHLMMSNPLIGSIITGESANVNFARAGRHTIALFDEGAFWPNLRSSYTSCAESTTCRFLVSTPNGMNMFGKLANPKVKPGEKATGPRKMRLHWSLDPRHNLVAIDNDPESLTFGKEINPWLEKQRLRYGYDPELMAQELDIDYRSSVKGRYYPQIDFSRLGRFAYDPTLPLYTAWDFGIGDNTAILWLQFDWATLRYRVVDCYQNRGKSIGWYVPFLTGLLPGTIGGETYTANDLKVIKRHAGWRYTAHFGDPSGNNKSQTSGTSVIDELAQAGIFVTCNYKENTHDKRRRATQRVLLHMDIDEDECTDFIDAIRNSKFPEKTEGHQDTSANVKPVHDEYSHYRTALEYFAVNDPHRYEMEDRAVSKPKRQQTVGAVFGNVDLYEKLSQSPDEYDEADFEDDENNNRAGLSVAGY